MTARKTPPSAWIPVIQSLFKEFVIGAIAIMSAWSIYIGQQNKQTVERVEKNTDGAITAALMVAMNATATTAKKTGDPDDIKIAKEAEDAYNAQAEVQRKAHDPNYK